MWYGMCRFSLEPYKTIYGPFKDISDAWEHIEVCAEKEYAEDIEESNWTSTMEKDPEVGEIIITTTFASGDVGTSLYCIFEINNTKLI